MNEETLSYIREATIAYRGPRRKPPDIKSPEAAWLFMRSLLTTEAKEHLLALYLDGGGKVISFSIVAIGCANHAPVHPREVFQPALVAGACAVVVGHNHPSDNVTPSAEDLAIEKKLKEAGELLSVKMLDFIIFSVSEYLSFQDRDML